MFSKTETKYKRKSERTELNSNWNENDFKTKMVTYNVKRRHLSCRRNRLSKNLEMRVFLKLNKDLVWLYDWVKSKLVEMPANAKLLLCNIVSSKMSVIDLLVNIINPETEIKTEIETEIRMIWKLITENETEK